MTTFALRIQPHVQAELDAAASAEALGHFHSAFQHLERAHVLGQRATVEHVRVHWHMFRFAVRNRRTGAAFGQAWRMVAAGLFTPLGLVPAGNTGGANVGGLRRMPVPGDLQALMQSARPGRGEATLFRRVATTLAWAGLAGLAMLGLGGCGTPPKDLDLALDKPSHAGVYRVALLPPAQAPAINQMHSWKVKLATPDGTPVHGATFAVDGGMPQHGHGLPTQPRVTRELADGTYQLDGMKFSMTGWWEVKLGIQGPQGADKVTFNTVVETPKGQP
ncbi:MULTISPECIES: DUF3703 domain-containing protein [Ramlibacter]|uniref:DUF3703 domain-containing protein n=1 Tax=Ramlibacter pinisoli TaxID=2682844 RepID=A0A6N8J1J4_9BURK|nr:MULTISPECIES: DUF3703 domain-containing protein [Ramlibacter]MBA2962103.1 DUF3703 domain-containing protein [Ramlibacter sp. CGMCC 1.13660]MVQ32046.1 DUF3703 domain-containing protein [Ramlibacter pinisoli]